MIKLIKTAELYGNVPKLFRPLFNECEYPWQIIPKIKGFLAQLIASEPKGYTRYSENVLIGEDVTIHPTATVVGPAIIGKGCELRTGAYIRENVIVAEDCVIGNSCEIKNSVIMKKCQIPHFSYVGDSVLGNRVHLGAGAICSNLKRDGRAVVIHSDVDFKTTERKLGAFLGDGADVGCGVVMNPGTVVGNETAVYPLTLLRGVYPAYCIVKSTNETVSKSCDNEIIL